MEGSRTGVGGGTSPELSMCYQCGNLCENSVTYCHSCYDLRSESDFRNEQRWRNAESDMQIVEASLQKEKATTQRLEGTLQSFRQMLMQGIHADVTIETGENDKTPAHRAVLVSFLSFCILHVVPDCTTETVLFVRRSGLWCRGFCSGNAWKAIA